MPLAVVLAGVGFGIALWFLMGHLTGGDDLFHLARVRKLNDLGSLSLRTVDEFRDGGLHPGYAFPLWHCFLALVARLAGVDPTAVVQHEASVLVPVAFLVAWESGKEVFRSAWGGLAVLATSVGIFSLAAGSGGSFTALALPATASRQLFVPAVIALFFAFVAKRSRGGLATIACATGALALIHPTYALFVLIPLVGFVAARGAARPARGRRGAAGPRRRRRPGGCGGALAASDRARDRVGQPVGGRGAPCPRALQGPARRLLGRELPARAGGARPERGARRRGAALRAACRPRGQAPLGRARARRVPARAGADAASRALHPLCRCRLDLAGTAGGRLRPLRLRPRRRRSCARPADLRRRPADRLSAPAPPSSSPIRATSATSSTRAVRRSSPGSRWSAGRRRWSSGSFSRSASQVSTAWTG